MTNHHDALFRHVFADPENAAALLRAALPPDLVEAIDWLTLELAPGSPVDDKLSAVHCDLLFSVRLRVSGRQLAVLCEHKSWLVELLSFFMLRYVVRYWEQCLQAAPGDPLPDLVALVVYHGVRPFRGAAEVGGAPPDADVPTSLVALRPQFRFLLDDLSSASELAIRARAGPPAATLALLCLRELAYTDRPVDALVRWRDLLAAVHATRPGALDPFLRYAQLVTDVPCADLARAVGSLLGDDAMKSVMSTGEKLIQEGLVRGLELGRIEGRELGKAEGKAEGLLAGKRDLLVQQLEGRFGVLPGECVARIAEATSERLDGWALRLLRAATLAEVFA